MRDRRSELDRTRNSSPVISNTQVRLVTTRRALPRSDDTANFPREQAANDLKPPEGDQQRLDAWVAEIVGHALVLLSTDPTDFDIMYTEGSSVLLNPRFQAACT
jgi:hypothetical protein